MNLKNSQLEVDNWIKNHGVRYFNELTNMAQLTEEVGEVARIHPATVPRRHSRCRCHQHGDMGSLLQLP